MLLGVARPLSVPEGVLKLTPLSRAGVGGGSVLRPPAAGRFAGGTGGPGLALTAGAAALRMPFGMTEGVFCAGRGAVGGGGGGMRAWGGAWISST